MKSIQVIRRYGGFGDLAMISRSLRKLQQMDYDVGLVLDKKWHALFEDWKELQLYEESVGVWDATIDISAPCPAAFQESRWVGDTRESSGKATVPIDRISIFAHSLGVQLENAEKIPYIACNKHRVSDVDKPAVYLQMSTAESYRDWPYMDRIAKALMTRGLKVWVQGHTEVPGVHRFSGSILDAVALIRHCALVVSPDSFAIHAAAAMGVPSVAIMGPIDPVSRIRHYPYASSITVDVPCVSCWRNENSICHKSGNMNSWCMKHLHEGSVYQHILHRLGESMQGQYSPSTKYVIAQSDKPQLRKA